MTEGVEEADDPSSLRPEWLQQFQHLLVGAAGAPGEMMDHEVLGVEVPDLDLIRIAV
jgi:hypothetical protein